jgi:hypothetical protein
VGLQASRREVGTGLGGAALLVGTGPVGIGLGIAALGLGAVGARNSFREKKWVGFGLDVAGIVPGAGGIAKGIKAIGATRDAGRLAGLVNDAVRSGAAAKAGGYNPNTVKASYLQNLSKQTEREAHRIENQGRRLDQASVGIGGVAAARTHLLPKVGLEYPPWILPAVSAMLPPASLSHVP